MATEQAKRLIAALKGVGLKHGGYRSGGDFTVRTEIKRRRMRDGLRYSEFHEAMAYTQGREPNAVIEQNADRLVLDGYSVTLVYSADDTLVAAIVSSAHNRRQTISILHGSEWSHRAARQQEVTT